jgi:hypothetical protein
MKKFIANSLDYTERDETAQVVAALYGVTPDYVRKVMRGERSNDAILKSCETYRSGKIKLLVKVKKTIKK